MARRVDLNLNSDLIAVRCGFKGIFPANVHTTLLRERSTHLADLIDEARKTGEKEIIISLLDSAKHRWCVWLYGQPLQNPDDDPNEALLELCAIYDFSVEGEDYECANACIDAIHEILLQNHDKLTIHLHTLIDSLGQRQEGSQMLIDMLVYGPCARSGKTREWLSECKVETHWADFFHRLSLALATRLANQAAGEEASYTTIVARNTYQVTVKEDSDSSETAEDVVGDDTFSNPDSLKEEALRKGNVALTAAQTVAMCNKI